MTKKVSTLQWSSACISFVSHRALGFSFVRLDGGMSMKQRLRSVEEFSNPAQGSPTIMLLSLKAGGVGINLVAASRVFLMDPVRFTFSHLDILFYKNSVPEISPYSYTHLELKWWKFCFIWVSVKWLSIIYLKSISRFVFFQGLESCIRGAMLWQVSSTGTDQGRYHHKGRLSDLDMNSLHLYRYYSYMFTLGVALMKYDWFFITQTAWCLLFVSVWQNIFDFKKIKSNI